MRIIYVIIAGLLISTLTIALATASHSGVADEPTRIELDQTADAIRFFIAGEERAVLDATGLRVHGDLSYTGALVDSGRAAFIGEMSETERGDNAP